MAKILVALDKAMTHAEWAEQEEQIKLGITRSIIDNRVYLGWEPNRIVTTPVKAKSKPSKFIIKSFEDNEWKVLNTGTFRSFALAFNFLNKYYPFKIFNKEIRIDEI